jgi:hypothetical protein
MDLPVVDIIPICAERILDPLYPKNHTILEPVCFVDASCGGLLCLGDPHYTTGIVITLGGMVIYAKTRLQQSIALSATESETMAGCDAGKIIKY